LGGRVLRRRLKNGRRSGNTGSATPCLTLELLELQKLLKLPVLLLQAKRRLCRPLLL
jgi:hypothetical protein